MTSAMKKPPQSTWRSIAPHLKSLSSDAISLTSGRIIYSLGIWIAIIVVARHYGAASLGQLNYAMAVTAPIIIFFQFNGRTFLLTDKQDYYGIKNYLMFRALGIIGALVATLTLCWLTPSHKPLLLLVFLFKSIESLSDITNAYLHREQHLTHVLFANSLRGMSFLLVALICAKQSLDLQQLCLYVSLTWLLIFLFVEIRPLLQANNLWQTIDFLHIVKLLRHCWIFGPVMAISTLLYNIPIFATHKILGTSYVGFYTSIMYFYLSGRLVIDGLSLAVASRASKFFPGDGGVLLHKSVILYSFFIIIPVAGLIAAASQCGHVVIDLVYGPEFSSYGFLLGYVVAGLCIAATNQLFNVIYTLRRDAGTQFKAHLLAFAVESAVAIPATKTFGLQGAAITFIVGMLVMSAYYAIKLARPVKADIR